MQKDRKNVCEDVARQRTCAKGEDSEKQTLAKPVVACDDGEADIHTSSYNQISRCVVCQQEINRPHFGPVMLTPQAKTGNFRC